MKRPTPKPSKTFFASAVPLVAERLGSDDYPTLWVDLNPPKVGANGKSRTPVIPPLGRYVHPESGPFEITEENRAQILANFKPGVPCGYNHGLMKPVTPEAGKRAGDILSLESQPDADGWVYGTVKWTRRAADYINEDEYSGISPTIWWKAEDLDGNQIGAKLMELSLTNLPLIEDVRLSVLGRDGLTEMSMALKKGQITKMMAMDGGEGGTLAKTRFDEASGRVMVVGPLTLAEGEEMAVALPDNLRIAPKEESSGATADPEKEQAMSASLTALSGKIKDGQTQLSALQAATTDAEARLQAIERKAFDTEIRTALTSMNVVPRFHARFTAMAVAAEKEKAGTGIEEMKKAVQEFGSAVIVDTDEPGHGGDPESTSLSTVGETELKKLRTEGKMTQREAMLQLARTNPEAFNAMQYQ